MRHGTLFDNRQLQLPLEKAVEKGVQQFREKNHLRDFEPGEVHFHPSEVPEMGEVGGLKLVANDEVRPGYIRVCTSDVAPAVEFAMSQQGFAQQVAGVVQL